MKRYTMEEIRPESADMVPDGRGEYVLYTDAEAAVKQERERCASEAEVLLGYFQESDVHNAIVATERLIRRIRALDNPLTTGGEG